MARISSKIKKKIRRDLRAGVASLTEIARRYRVSITTVFRLSVSCDQAAEKKRSKMIQFKKVRRYRCDRCGGYNILSPCPVCTTRRFQDLKEIRPLGGSATPTPLPGVLPPQNQP